MSNNAQIQEKLDARDSPFLSLYIYPKDFFASELPKVSEEDISVLQRGLAGIDSIITVSSVYVSNIQFQGVQTSDAQVQGGFKNYQKTMSRKILQGRFLESADFDQYRPVAVVDEALSRKLFEGGDPIGQGLYAGRTRFTVVGLSETKQSYADEEPAGELWVTQNYFAL